MPEKIFRVDYAVEGSLSKWERTPSGGFRLPARLNRTGVLVYELTDGSIRREYRAPEEVFADAAMASLRGCPVTLDHPPPNAQGERMVTPETWGELAVGHVDSADLRSEGPYSTGFLRLERADAIAAAEAEEIADVSCGYSAIFVPEPGVSPDGEPYDGRQVGIIHNHVALGPKGWGRSGIEVGLRIDGRDATEISMSTPATGTQPRKHRVDGIEFEAGSESHVSAVDKRIATLEADLKVAREEATREKQRADSASDPLVVRKAARLRASHLALCLRVHPDKATRPAYLDKADAEVATDDDTILRDILKQMSPNLKIEGKDHAWLMQALEMAMAMKGGAPEPAEPGAAPTDGIPPDEKDPLASAADSHAATRVVGNAPPPRTDGDELKARQDSARKALRDRWKNPATQSKGT